MKKNTVTVPSNSKSAVKKASPENSTFAQFLQMLPENKEFTFRFLDFFPYMVEIFAPDGTLIFINRLMIDLNKVTDSGLVVGKYNLLKDPVCNDQMGMREGIHKAFFHNEPCAFYDVSAPVQDLIDRGVAEQKPYENSFMDFHLYPVKDKGKLLFVVFICNAKKLYYGRPDVAKAKEYIDTHWQGVYDKEKVAQEVGMSVTQLYRVFKEHTGMTPGDYQKEVKVEHIKEKLADKNLSVKEAFAACGEDSRGWMLRVFKQITGMTPTEFRSRNSV